MIFTGPDEGATSSNISRNIFGVALVVSLIIVVGFVLWVWISNEKTRNDKGNKENVHSDEPVANGNASVSKASANNADSQVDLAKKDQAKAEVLDCNEANIPDNSITSSRAALPGFYVAIRDDRSKLQMYSDSSKDLSPAFRQSGFPAFYGSASTTVDPSSIDIQFLEKSDSTPIGWGTIFVGPFQDDSAARARLLKMISILKRHIPRDNSVGIEGDDPRILHSYTAKIVRVVTNKVAGTLANLRPSDYTIQPGVGVGRIRLGIGRCEVLSLLGRPRNTEESLDDWWSDPGKEGGLRVIFRKSVVSEIELTDPKFHCVAGLRPGARTQSFRKEFPGTEGYSCGGGGSGGFSPDIIVDAVRNGITASYNEESTQIETLTVYTVGEPLSHDKSGQCKKIW